MIFFLFNHLLLCCYFKLFILFFKFYFPLQLCNYYLFQNKSQRIVFFNISEQRTKQYKLEMKTIILIYSLKVTFTVLLHILVV